VLSSKRSNSRSSTKENTDSLKGKLVNSREGSNWQLTADTFGDVTQLNGGYILDGKKIKLGIGKAGEAASEVVADIVRLHSSC